MPARLRPDTHSDTVPLLATGRSVPSGSQLGNASGNPDARSAVCSRLHRFATGLEEILLRRDHARNQWSDVGAVGEETSKRGTVRLLICPSPERIGSVDSLHRAIAEFLSIRASLLEPPLCRCNFERSLS